VSIRVYLWLKSFRFLHFGGNSPADHASFSVQQHLTGGSFSSVEVLDNAILLLDSGLVAGIEYYLL